MDEGVVDFLALAALAAVMGYMSTLPSPTLRVNELMVWASWVSFTRMEIKILVGRVFFEKIIIV